MSERNEIRRDVLSMPQQGSLRLSGISPGVENGILSTSPSAHALLTHAQLWLIEQSGPCITGHWLFNVEGAGSGDHEPIERCPELRLC